MDVKYPKFILNTLFKLVNRIIFSIKIFSLRLSARNSLWPTPASKRPSIVIPAGDFADVIDYSASKRVQYGHCTSSQSWKSRTAGRDFLHGIRITLLWQLKAIFDYDNPDFSFFSRFKISQTRNRATSNRSTSIEGKSSRFRISSWLPRARNTSRTPVGCFFFRLGEMTNLCFNKSTWTFCNISPNFAFLNIAW